MTRPQLVDFAARPTIVKDKANLRKRFPVDAILSCVEFKKTTDMAAPPKAWPRDQQPRFANPKTIDDVIQAWDKNCSRDAPVSAESSAAANNPSTPGVTAPSTSSSLHPAGQKRKAVAEDDIGFNSQETNRQRTAVEIEPEVYPPVVQSASYGLLSLNRAAGVLKVISMFVEDQTLWLWIYDRQGAIQSYGLDFIKDFPRFVVLLAAFQRFNRQDWGFNPDLEPLRVPTDPVKLIFTTPGTGSAPIHTYTVTLTNDILYERPTLCGRASHVVTVTVERDGEAYTGEGAGGDEFVLKVGWPESTRISEVQIIAKAKEIADQEPEGKHYITGHLPEVICSKDLPESYATGTIRTALGLLPKQMRGGSRTCRLTVFVKLRMLTGLPPLHFLSLFRPIVTCHFFLWIKGVKHCDISLQNLMRHPRTGLGILNDFDLSRIDGYQSENLERTGTVPFLSMDILSNPDFQRGRGLVEATYKHDCDSFKWVFLYVCCIDTPNSVVEQWHTNDPEKCLLVKSNFLVPLISDVPFKDAAFARDRRLTRLRRQAALADEQTVLQLQGDRGFLAVPQDEPKRGVKPYLQLHEPEEEPVPLSVVPSELWDVFMDMLDDLQPSSGR
ncbi:hypothetical protein FIBSPDRAFT_13352 [Athelia psychrophila]|uniref:Fungal-type protein kinase domain-containing protein n=1 Tax=Athelia psychrophila TaxID=1759441 RepID=A0A166XCM9_9AGAM|nr:hypothetical protein FIBSPDRAFT_13352 [Fibularhizoctonia sp. CBS 109695]